MQCRFWEFNLNPITGWRVAKNHRKAAQLAERKYIKVLKPMPAYRSLVV